MVTSIQIEYKARAPNEHAVRVTYKQFRFELKRLPWICNTQPIVLRHPSVAIYSVFEIDRFPNGTTTWPGAPEEMDTGVVSRRYIYNLAAL